MTDSSGETAPWAVRRIGPESASALALLWAETFRNAYASVHSPADIEAYCSANYSLERAREALSDPRQICKLAFRDGVPTGLYVLKRHACPIALEGPVTELKQLYILASEYGSGLGYALMQDAIEAARACEARHFWLAVADSNRRAQTFYLKHGFTALGAGPTFGVGSDRLMSTIMVLAMVARQQPQSDCAGSSPWV